MTVIILLRQWSGLSLYLKQRNAPYLENGPNLGLKMAKGDRKIKIIYFRTSCHSERRIRSLRQSSDQRQEIDFRKNCRNLQKLVHPEPPPGVGVIKRVFLLRRWVGERSFVKKFCKFDGMGPFNIEGVYFVSHPPDKYAKLRASF